MLMVIAKERLDTVVKTFPRVGMREDIDAVHFLYESFGLLPSFVDNRTHDIPDILDVIDSSSVHIAKHHGHPDLFVTTGAAILETVDYYFDNIRNTWYTLAKDHGYANTASDYYTSINDLIRTALTNNTDQKCIDFIHSARRAYGEDDWVTKLLIVKQLQKLDVKPTDVVVIA